MTYNDDELKLIYVLKIGYNSNNEGLYEFIFSKDETNIDVEGWCWDLEPACDNAQPPTGDYVDAVFGLKTSSFDLYCLHEAVERPYMHGYHTIHALAYEVDRPPTDVNGFEQFEKLIDSDDVPLMVFHYGITLTRVKEILYSRKIILKNNQFVETSSIKFE